MGVRSVYKQTLLYAFSIALMRGISLIMLPFIAQYLSPEEFGQVELLSSIAMVGSVLVGLGLEDALYRFAGIAKTEQLKKKAASLIFTLTIIMTILFGLASFPLAHGILSILPGDLELSSVKIVLLILALEGMISVPLGWVRMNDRAELFCAFNIGRVIVQASLTFYFLHQGFGVNGVFLAGLISALLQVVGLSYIQIKDTGLSFDNHLCKKVIIYSLPLVGSGLLAFGLNGFDRWVIADVLSMQSLAIYGIAAKFSIALTILMQPFGMWWSPRRFIELNKEKGHERVLYFSVLALIGLIILMLATGLSAPWIIALIMPISYHEAGLYVVALLIVVTLKEACELINIGCFIDSDTKIQLGINISATIVGCLSMVIFTQYFHLWGVILSLGMAQGLRLHLFFYYSQRRITLAYPIKQLYLLFALATADLGFSLVIFSNYLTTESMFTHIAILCVLLVFTLWQAWQMIGSQLHSQETYGSKQAISIPRV